jgi:hypothetical protein
VSSADSAPLAARGADVSFGQPLTNLPDVLVQCESIQLFEWQARKKLNAATKGMGCISKRLALLDVGASYRCRIRHAPVRGHRLPRPERTRLGGGLIVDRNHKVELRRVRSGEFFPALASQAVDRDPLLTQELERERMDFAFRMTPRAVRAEFAGTDARMIHEGFGDN